MWGVVSHCLRSISFLTTGRCEYWIADIDLMKHQGNNTASFQMTLQPEVYTATVACVYNVDRECKGNLPPSVSTL